MNFNGDDTLVLLHSATTLDVLGQIGFDPGSAWGTNAITTLDHTLRAPGLRTRNDRRGPPARLHR